MIKMNEDPGRGGGGAVAASNSYPSGSASLSARPQRQRPTLGIPSNSGTPSFFSGKTFFAGKYYMSRYCTGKNI